MTTNDLFQNAPIEHPSSQGEAVTSPAAERLTLTAHRLAVRELASANSEPAPTPNENTLLGQRVCFTGELMSTLDGQPITRDTAKTLATQAGLIVASSVTKTLDILVVADPNTLSGKAKKARRYGIRILSDAVFWRMIGVSVD